MSQDQVFDVLVVGAGQAGLATAYHLQRQGLSFLVLEATDQAAGSWRRYYDSLLLFSPARFSSLPGFPFPGDSDRYPTGPEVADYLSKYAAEFGFPIRYDSTVIGMIQTSHGFEIECRNGQKFHSRTVVIATGSFAYPNVPKIAGDDLFGGERLHAIHYKNPESFHAKRVVVVGAGNTAVQIAHELSAVARTTLATRGPIRYFPQRVFGKDLHWWLRYTKLDQSCLLSDRGAPVLDDGRYRSAIRSGSIHHRPMFSRFTATGVVWKDGTLEDVDSVIYGTGYKSTAEFLGPIGALDENADIAQQDGRSSKVPGLYFVGFSLQRNFASATLRGVGPDAAVVTREIVQKLRGKRPSPGRSVEPTKVGSSG